MNVSLTPELEELISQKVKSGMYNSASEVIRESLRRMFREDTASKRVITEEQRQQMDNLRQEVLKGYEQIRNGQSRTYTSVDEMFDEITTEARNEFEARKQNGKL
jgi:antitoxin ParD1/3/4